MTAGKRGPWSFAERITRARLSVERLEIKLAGPLAARVREISEMDLQTARAKLEKLTEAKKMQPTTPTPLVEPPHAGWSLIAKRRMISDGTVFDRGAQVPVAKLGKNFQALLDRGFVGWKPPGEASPVKPHAMPVTKSRPPNPKVEIVAGTDPLDSYLRTKARLTELCGGDSRWADDLLCANHAAADLRAVAVRVDAEREALKNKMSARRIARAI